MGVKNLVLGTALSLAAGAAAAQQEEVIGPSFLDLENPIEISFGGEGDPPALEGCLTDGVPTTYFPTIFIYPTLESTLAEREALAVQAHGLMEEAWEEIVSNADSTEMLGEALSSPNSVHILFAEKVIAAGLAQPGQFELPLVTMGPTLNFGGDCEPSEEAPDTGTPDRELPVFEGPSREA